MVRLWPPPLLDTAPLVNGFGWRVHLPEPYAAAVAQIKAAQERSAARCQHWQALAQATPQGLAVDLPEVQVLSYGDLLMRAAAAGRLAPGDEAAFRAYLDTFSASLRTPLLVETWRTSRCYGRSGLRFPAALATVWPAEAEPAWAQLHLDVVGLVYRQRQAEAELHANILRVAGQAATRSSWRAEALAAALWDWATRSLPMEKP